MDMAVLQCGKTWSESGVTMRYISGLIAADLKKKMVFIGGPRQVGKTTLAKSFLGEESLTPSAYFNWDNPDHRLVIQKRSWKSGMKFIIFDELHKLKRWKSWIKGIYDVEKETTNFLVTGSARLDVYRRGGDSLQGRYHYWRLHPFTLDECPPDLTPQECYQRLLTVGGFPEPFFANNLVEAARWRRERYERFVREDIRDLESVRDLQTLSLFAELLRERVQSVVTLSNLARDLEISPVTAKHWLTVFESMYYVFVLRPFTFKLSRSVKKQPKVYFFDNGEIESPGAKLENLVATHLLKRVHFLQDAYGENLDLYFLRDKDGREVDFVIARGGKIEELYEVKLSDGPIDESLRYYTKKLKPKRSFQVVGTNERSFEVDGIQVISPWELFSKPLAR
jgi:predicted AAA+ superfamily ATPase